jgi:hypothetical protein
MPESWKEQILEILIVIKTSITSFWFWLPALFAAAIYIDLWLMINVHPLIGAVLPIIFTIYALRVEEKRIKSRYDLKDKRYLKALHGFGQLPEPDRKLELMEELAKSKKKEEKSN